MGFQTEMPWAAAATTAEPVSTPRFGSGGDFWAALALLGHRLDQPVRVGLSRPEWVPGFRRPARSLVLRFFLNAGDREPCYFGEKCRSRGFRLSDFPIGSLVDFQVLEPASQTGPTAAQLAQRARKHFHPNLWQKLAAEIEADPVKATHYKRPNEMRLVDIRRHFNPATLDWIAKAIEEKRDFRFEGNGTKRNFRAEGKLCEDGQYCAWYSSEYAGCANGSYYLLISPTIAFFREDD
jgi:hypothetical protein